MSLSTRFRSSYGAPPLHLLSLLGCFALAGYAALRAAQGPAPVRMAVWFFGAVLAHDLVLFPLYALADRSLGTLLSRRTRRLDRRAVSARNHLRVPLLLSGLLLLLFWPLVLRHSEPAYRTASGLDQDPYLERYLLVTGLLFAGSAVAYALRLGRR